MAVWGGRRRGGGWGLLTMRQSMSGPFKGLLEQKPILKLLHWPFVHLLYIFCASTHNSLCKLGFPFHFKYIKVTCIQAVIWGTLHIRCTTCTKKWESPAHIPLQTDFHLTFHYKQIPSLHSTTDWSPPYIPLQTDLQLTFHYRQIPSLHSTTDWSPPYIPLQIDLQLTFHYRQISTLHSTIDRSPVHIPLWTDLQFTFHYRHISTLHSTTDMSPPYIPI